MDIRENFYSKLQTIREEADQLDEEKIKMHGIPNKVTPKNGKLRKKGWRAIDATNNLFKRMDSLKRGDVKAAGNTKKK